MPDDVPAIVALYRELAALSREEQRSRELTLPLEVRAALWSFHLRRFREVHPELSMEQQQAIGDALEFLQRPGFFAAEDELQREPGLEAEWSAFKERARVLFPPPLLFAVFYRFGEDVPEFPADAG